MSGAHDEVVHEFDGHAVLAFEQRCDDVIDVGRNGLTEGAVP